MIRIAIVEDDKKERALIQEYVRRFSNEKSLEIKTEEFTDGLQLIQEYHRNFDVLFLDIEMEKLNGLEAARQIRKTDRDVMILFITNLVQYAIEGYEVDAADFIVKPLVYTSFCMRMEKVIKKLDLKIKKLIPLRVKKETIMLNAHDIILVETRSKKTLIRFNEEEVGCSETMSEVQKKLESYGFFRCHNSFLVNMAYIDRLDGNIAIVKKYEIPISKHRKKEFYQAVVSYQGMLL